MQLRLLLFGIAALASLTKEDQLDKAGGRARYLTLDQIELFLQTLADTHPGVVRLQVGRPYYLVTLCFISESRLATPTSPAKT